MSRRACRGSRCFRVRIAALGVISASLLAICGCLHSQTRLQADEENEKDRYEVKTIGQVAQVGNHLPLQVWGVGLVVGLNGTGSPPPASSYRSMLEADLLKKKLEDTSVKKLLSQSDISLVLVSAIIPPGAHRDDTVDVNVILPPGSRTTSLRGGRLLECDLYNYDLARNLSQTAANPDAILKGQLQARAEGPLLVGFGAGDEAERVKQGRIWNGARVRAERPFYLALNEGQQFARIASIVADRINETFQARFPGGPSGEIALATNSQGVFLSVPQQYKHNLPRYLRVVCLIPMRIDAAAGEQGAYRRMLGEDVLDPAHCITAALRLEALGKESVPLLKRGLQSDRPLVRFAAAEALAYLGEPSCGQVLAQSAEEFPDLRAYALVALASLDEAASRVQLRRLMGSSQPELRYGAFVGLRNLDSRDPMVQGKMLNDSFWLHRVLPGSTPLVHFSTGRRAEIVLFGEDAQLKPPFSILAGEFTIKAPADDTQCTIGHFSPAEHIVNHRQCSLRLEEIITVLAEEGALYPEAVEMLRQATARGSVSCRVENDALPQASPELVYELADLGRKGKNSQANVDPALVERDEEIRNARADLGATPTLFDRGNGRRSRTATEHEDESMMRDRRGAAGSLR
jgi:flagellar basal body P-ring protein FlgI